MSSPGAYTFFAGVGFSVEWIRTIIESGPNMESFYNGMFGALGALIVKISYDVIVKLIKQHKQNVRERKIGQGERDGI